MPHRLRVGPLLRQCSHRSLGENCSVDRERQWFELPASIPRGAVHGFVPVASRARHHVACQELHDAVGDGLGLLDVEEVTDAVDGAVLDVRE